MGKVYPAIDEKLSTFIAGQHVFFVATAPLGSNGHVNLSPKGLDSFRILNDRTVAYLDFVGSGIETIAHLRENGRIVIMFCAFDGPAKIVRLHGRGRVIEPADLDFSALRSRFPNYAGVRSIIRIDCERISDSCGDGVPLFRFEGHRTRIQEWAETKGPEGLADYQRRKNVMSCDGLPGVTL